MTTVYALTGGIASGKSSVRQLCEKMGFPTLDADIAAREIVAPNQPGLVEIERIFGSDILTKGELNRSKLRELIFQNAEAKQQLEAILHPMIRQRLTEQVEQLKQTEPQAIIVEIPLLTETGKPDYVDKVIVLDIPPELQIQRAIARNPELSSQQVKRIIQQQASRTERRLIADHLIDATQPLYEIEQQLRDVILSA